MFFGHFWYFFEGIFDFVNNYSSSIMWTSYSGSILSSNNQVEIIFEIKRHKNDKMTIFQSDPFSITEIGSASSSISKWMNEKIRALWSYNLIMDLEGHNYTQLKSNLARFYRPYGWWISPPQICKWAFWPKNAIVLCTQIIVWDMYFPQINSLQPWKVIV